MDLCCARQHIYVVYCLLIAWTTVAIHSVRHNKSYFDRSGANVDHAYAGYLRRVPCQQPPRDSERLQDASAMYAGLLLDLCFALSKKYGNVFSSAGEDKRRDLLRARPQ